MTFDIDKCKKSKTVDRVEIENEDELKTAEVMEEFVEVKLKLRNSVPLNKEIDVNDPDVVEKISGLIDSGPDHRDDDD